MAPKDWLEKTYKAFSFLGLTHAEARFVLLVVAITMIGALIPYLRPFWEEKVFSQDFQKFTASSASKDSLSEGEKWPAIDSVEQKRWQLKADSIRTVLAEDPSRGTIDSLMANLNDEPVRAININTAKANEIASLPRVGPKLAERIVEYRNQNGSFRTVDELRNVKGIGKKMFDKIKSLITVE